MRLGRQKWLVGLMVTAMALSLGALAQEKAASGVAPVVAGHRGQADQSPPEFPPAEPPPPIRKAATARTITYSYDANGRLTGVDYGEGKAITYRYDNAGNIIQQGAGAPGGAAKAYIPALFKQFASGW